MSEDFDADFASAVRRAGLVIPPDRATVMRDAYRELQLLLRVLDAPLGYVDEPAVALDLSKGSGP